MTRFVGAGLFVLVLASFLMPWVSVECSGIQVQATGLDIAAGRDVEYAGTTGEVSVEPLVFLALVLAVVGVGLFFLRIRAGTIIRIVTGLLGVITLIVFKFKAESTAYNAFREGNGQLEDLAGLVTINWEVGFWIALLAFWPQPECMVINCGMSVNCRSHGAGQHGLLGEMPLPVKSTAPPLCPATFPHPMIRGPDRGAQF